MRKIISALLCVCMLLTVSVVAFSVSAKESNSYGDMDGNYEVTASDALTVLQGAVNKVKLDSKQSYFADVDLDDKVSSSDALMVLQYAVGKITVIPAGDYKKYDNLLVDTSNTIVDNGAYSKDVSADTSFQITTEGLAEKTIYFCSDSVVYIAGLTKNVNMDVARFFICLQGLINRDYGITHTSMVFLKYNSNDAFWYRELTSSDQFKDYNIVNIKTFEDMVTTFKAQIEQVGITFWDPAVPATANVAETICGLDGYLPVKYDTTENSFYNKLSEIATNKGINITVKMNLVGKFETPVNGKIVDTNINTTGSSKCDAYLWAMDKYFNRCSTKYLTWMPDGAVSVDGNPMSEQSTASNAYDVCILSHDYFIARRCFFYDLSTYTGEAPCDDKTQTPGTDYNTLVRLYTTRYNRANGNFGQVLGFPPFWLKYTTFNGNSDKIDPTAMEWLSVEVQTIYNLAKEADAYGPQTLENASVYYKYISTTEKFENNEPEEIEYDPNTKYYSFFVGDYDSSAWLSYFVRSYWSDSKRGQMPLNWAFNPNLIDRVPLVFDYAYQNKTSKDYFITGDSGAGYVYPSALLADHSVTTRNINRQIFRTMPDGTEKYYAYASKYYNLLGMDVTGWILNKMYDMPEGILKMYNKLSPVGAMYMADNHNQRIFKYNGVPYMTLTSTDGVLSEQTISMYAAVNAGTGHSNYCAFRVVCVSPTAIYKAMDGIQSRAEQKGKSFKCVDIYTLMKFAAQDENIPNWKSAYN